MPTLPAQGAPIPPTAVADAVAANRVAAPSTVWQRLFRPGWPLAAILVPFPLWWALGLSEWIVPIMALPMVAHLLRQRHVLAPRGMGWWIAFLLWVVAGGFLLQVDAFGAVADNSSTRLLTFSYRLVWYLSITVVLLYVLNTRRELSGTRIVRIVACLFVTVTLGGLLGVVAPNFEFTSLTELLMPVLGGSPGRALANSQLVHSMIHPEAAQLQVVLGFVSPRPSAPYTFTNTWGLNFAVTLPFFLYAWLGRDAGWRRWAAGPVLLVAAVPLIYSLNRGLWGACVAMALFVAVRAALTGRPGLLAGILAGAAALALLLAVSPLGTIVSLRFANKGSEEGRTHLGTLTVRSVTVTSPIVGLGSTRNVQGNFQSITGGSTAECPRCSPPALGTQGQLWLVVFSQGLVGLGLFLTFFVLNFLRHIRLRSPVATVALSAMVAWAVTLPVYNSLGTGMLVVMVAVALLCREGAAGLGSLPTFGDRSITLFGRYTSALGAGIPVIALCCLAGTAAGWGWDRLAPSPYEATTSVVLGESPTYPAPDKTRVNVDTEAQLVASSTVREAAAKASHQPLSSVANDLTVTATPNSRVLHLHLSAPTAAAAQAGVDAATNAFLHLRTVRLEADRTAELSKLEASAMTLSAHLSALNHQVESARAQGSSGNHGASAAVARDLRNELLPQLDAAHRQWARVAGVVLSGGRSTGAAVVTRSADALRVDLVSGATAGLGLGALIAVLWGAAGPRLRRIKDVAGHTGLPLLARTRGTGREITRLARLFGHQPLAYVAAVEGDDDASWVGGRLTDATSKPAHRGAGTVIVASGRTRVDKVRAAHDQLILQGASVRGVLLAVDAHPRRRWLRRVRAFRPSAARGRAILERASSRRRDER